MNDADDTKSQLKIGSIFRRLVIPAAVLVAFVAFAALWVAGLHGAYRSVLRFIGVEPFSFPFVDIFAVLSAAECYRAGVNVFVSNPCFVSGIPHVYSPLWLSVIPSYLVGANRVSAGVILDLIFILSLWFIFKPVNRPQILILGLAALSPMTIYALERANNDVLIFIVIVFGLSLYQIYRLRWGAYAIFFFAGLLKYYPVTLLILIARERLRHAVPLTLFFAIALVLFVNYYHAELRMALANISRVSPSYFTDAFSARNLLYGIAEQSGAVTAIFILGGLVVVTATTVRRSMRLLGDADINWKERELEMLAVASILIITCFFAGQNINYRGIYLLLALPGLLQFNQFRCPLISRWSSQMISAVLFLMWGEFFRRGIHGTVGVLPTEWLRSRIEILFWVGRELIWWWLIAGLLAIAFLFVWNLSLAEETRHYLRRSRKALTS